MKWFEMVGGAPLPLPSPISTNLLSGQNKISSKINIMINKKESVDLADITPVRYGDLTSLWN